MDKLPYRRQFNPMKWTDEERERFCVLVGTKEEQKAMSRTEVAIKVLKVLRNGDPGPNWRPEE